MSPQITPRRSPAEVAVRAGFTIVELMVALIISAGVLLAGRLLLEQISSAEHVIVSTVAAQDTALQQDLALESVIRNIDVYRDSTDVVHGNDHIVRFASWCNDTTAFPIPRTPCTVELTVDTVVTLATSLASTITVRRLSTMGELRYLADARDGGQWYRSWGPSLIPPLALGIIAGADTMVLRFGDRG